MTRVLLLDIDGVLVRPGGYRAALHATLNYFVNLMGLAPFRVPRRESWLGSKDAASPANGIWCRFCLVFYGTIFYRVKS